MRERLDTAARKTTAFLGSGYFLAIVIGFFVINALWIAFSLRHPMLYDESYHFQVVQLLSGQWSPFVDHPEKGIEGLRALIYSSNSIFYHYVMSFPYRVLDKFTDNTPAIIIALRAINVAFVALGLWIYSRVLRKISMQQIFINLGLLFFTLLPIVPFVAAHISYDNMLFVLTAWYLLFCVSIVRSKQVRFLDFAGVVIVGCLASLAKTTFLPIFAASIIYILALSLYRYKNRLLSDLWVSFKKVKRPMLIFVVAAIVLTGGLFSTVYVYNVVKYGAVKPLCGETLSQERCLELDDRGLIERGVEWRETVNSRSVTNIANFSNGWFARITNFSLVGANRTLVSAPPILIDTIFFGVIIGLGALLYSWRSFRKNAGWYFLITIAAVLVLSVYYVNASGYYKVHAIAANQPRYLLSVLPIMIVMSIVAFNYVLGRRRLVKAGFLIVALLLFSQGGGAATTIINSNDTWYWQNPYVSGANHDAKQALKPLIKETLIFE